MGIITGYICLVCLVLLFLKYVANHLSLKGLNRVLMKLHKFVALGLLVAGIVHFCLVFKLIGSNPIHGISGIAIWVLGVLLTTVCHVLKDREKEIRFHRGFSLAMLIMVIVHMVTYFC